MKQLEYPNYLTVKEVADILRLAERTVQRLCRQGKIGSTKLGKHYRIPQESLDEYQKIRR
jgi:excisionase family DNA binding protein